MILVDTSIWIAHLRHSDPVLIQLLTAGRVLAHPFVIGELALVNLRQRDTILNALQSLPQASIAADDEVLRLIGQYALSGLGIGYIDAHLLAGTRLTAGACLWTRDKRLAAAARTLRLAADVHL